jgi:hypothetical protein
MSADATIGSSDVAHILGVGAPSGVHRATPWQTWARLVGLVPRYDSTDTADAAAGRMLEPGIGQRYAAERQLVWGADIMPGPPITSPPLRHQAQPWMACRPDFILPTRRRVVEAKAPRDLDERDGWGEPGSSAVPSYYLVQVSWQMAVLEAEGADLAAFGVMGADWRVYTIPRRERLIRGMVARVNDWREAYVLTGTPPPIDGSDACADGLSRLHPGQGPKVHLDATPADRALLRDLATVRAQLRDLEAAKGQLENELRDRLGDAHGLRADGRVVASLSAAGTLARIDADRLRREHPELAAAYSTTTDTRRRLVVRGLDEE